MKRILNFLGLLPMLALAGTPLSLKYDSQTGSTVDIPSTLHKLNFPAGFELQVDGVPIGGNALPSQTGNSGKYLSTNGTIASWVTLNVANWDTAYTDRLKWDGGATGLVAATGRISLGLGTLATQNGTFSGTSSGTNTGDQTISLTGDVTGSGTGSFAATIANSAVTLAKMSNMATASLIYRKTAGSGAPEVNTLATLKTDLGLTGTNSGDQDLSGYQTKAGILALGGFGSITGTVPIANLPTGTSGSMVALGNHTHTGVYLAPIITSGDPYIDFDPASGNSPNLILFRNNEVGTADFGFVLNNNPGENGESRKDNTLIWGYNVSPTGRQNTSEHRFSEQVESRYMTPSAILQLEHYWLYQNAAGIAYRPFGQTIHLADDFIETAIRNNKFIIGWKDTTYDWLIANSTASSGTLVLSLNSALDFTGNTKSDGWLVTMDGVGLIGKSVGGYNALFSGHSGASTDTVNLFAGANTDLGIQEIAVGAPSRKRGLRWNGQGGTRQWEAQNDSATWKRLILSGDSLSEFGGTIVGINIATLTNPSAITFLQINANNTVTAQSASAQRTALSLVPGTDIVAFGGALGTPSSGALTNATGLPIGGISGLGTGLATWLATPSSANLRAAITDENGTGALLFDGATSPAFVTPALGTPSGVVLTNATSIPAGQLTGSIADARLSANVPLLNTANTFSLNQTNSYASTASTPAMLYSGAWFTGGDGTTDFPHLLIQPTGATAATTWTGNGTALGINAASGFAGNLIDVRTAGTYRFKVDASGNATINGAITIDSGQVNWGSSALIYSPASGVLRMSTLAGTGFTGLDFRSDNNSGFRLGFAAVNGIDLQSGAGTTTWNDASTAGSGTVANRYLFGIAAPTLTATNSSVTDTVASTFYIGGAPTAGTNNAIGTAWALNVAAGNTNLGGTVTIGGGTAVAKILSATATLDFGSTAAGAVSDLTITVTGAALGDVVSLGIPNASVPASGTFSAWVSSTNTVTVRYENNDLLTARDPASGTFRVMVTQF